MMWKIVLVLCCASVFVNAKSLQESRDFETINTNAKGLGNVKFSEVAKDFFGDEGEEGAFKNIYFREVRPSENDNEVEKTDIDSSNDKNTNEIMEQDDNTEDDENLDILDDEETTPLERDNEIAQISSPSNVMQNLIGKFPNTLQPILLKMSENVGNILSEYNNYSKLSQEKSQMGKELESQAEMKKYLEFIVADQQKTPQSPLTAEENEQKLQQFLQESNINSKPSSNDLNLPNSKVGAGQVGSSKLQTASLTEYVQKVVTNAKNQILKLGPKITSNNPPLVINEIPGLQIVLTLRHLIGASTIHPYGESKGIYFNKMYAFTQYKFEQLKYFYDVEIRPLGIFSIPTTMGISLSNANTKMHVSVEKEKRMNLLHLEFVKPNMYVDFGNYIFNLGANYVINNVHPVVKAKFLQIVSRDTKLMLDSFIKEAQ